MNPTPGFDASIHVIRSAARQLHDTGRGMFELRTAIARHLPAIQAHDEVDENRATVRDRLVRQCQYWVRSRAAVQLDAICALAEELQPIDARGNRPAAHDDCSRDARSSG